MKGECFNELRNHIIPCFEGEKLNHAYRRNLGLGQTLYRLLTIINHVYKKKIFIIDKDSVLVFIHRAVRNVVAKVILYADKNYWIDAHSNGGNQYSLRLVN